MKKKYFDSAYRFTGDKGLDLAAMYIDDVPFIFKDISNKFVSEDRITKEDKMFCRVDLA